LPIRKRAMRRELGLPTLNSKCRRPPFRGNGREIVMRRVLTTAALSVAAMGLSAPAFAAIQVTNTNGTPLANQIFGIANVGTTVYGSSPNNNNVTNVTFTCNSTCDMRSGFVQINDATPNIPE